MTIKENLIAARALIDTPEKWGKGSGSHPPAAPSMCALGAAGRAADGFSDQEADALYEALEGYWRERSVHEFNDHFSTTHADIMALFDRAIAAQDDD